MYCSRLRESSSRRSNVEEKVSGLFDAADLKRDREDEDEDEDGDFGLNVWTVDV